MKKLTFEYDYSEEFVLIGISTQIRDYRLVWFLNKIRNVKLVKKDNLDSLLAKNVQGSFSFFSHDDIENLSSFCLVSNNSENGRLLTDHKHFDFLLFISGPEKEELQDYILNEIKKIDQVMMVLPIEIHSLKNGENVLIDLELHIVKLSDTMKAEQRAKKNKLIKFNKL